MASAARGTGSWKEEVFSSSPTTTAPPHTGVNVQRPTGDAGSRLGGHPYREQQRDDQTVKDRGRSGGPYAGSAFVHRAGKCQRNSSRHAASVEIYQAGPPELATDSIRMA